MYCMYVDKNGLTQSVATGHSWVRDRKRKGTLLENSWLMPNQTGVEFALDTEDEAK